LVLWGWNSSGSYKKGVLEFKDNDQVIHKYSITNSEGESTDKAIQVFRSNNWKSFYLQDAIIDDNGEIQPIDEGQEFRRVLP
jgi:hypothetical protein